MKKEFIFSSLGIFICLITLFSCKEDNDPQFKEGREIYMNNPVNVRIIFPAEKDTILYKDTLSGFPIRIENEMFYMTTHIEDTITFRGQKRDMKIILKPTEFHITEMGKGERKFNLEGEATLYLNIYQSNLPVDTIPLKFIPSEGSIKGNELYYYESATSLENETQPYITLRFRGVKIS